MKAGRPAEAIDVLETCEPGGRKRLADRTGRTRPANQLKFLVITFAVLRKVIDCQRFMR